MNDHPRHRGWGAWLLAAILSIGVGVLAYNAGVSRGLALHAPAGFAAYPWYPPYWFHPFGFVFPLFMLFFWFAFARFLFWGGAWRRRWHHETPDGVPPRFEQWHRQMHERMDQNAAGGTRT
jgi:hypothetical protein